MAAVVERIITADELWQMPDDGLRHELIRGELTAMAPAGFHHGVLAGDIHASLSEYARKEGLGAVTAAETGFKLSVNPDTVRAPDVAFVAQRRVDAVGLVPGFFPGAPDLVVEVISPGDTYSEVQDKVFDWLEAGTRLVVVVDPRKQRVMVHSALSDLRILTGQDTLDGGEVVPGWRLPVAAIFKTA
jgi:Uma2 family endonuclease